MEKDYFKDRPIQCTQRDFLLIGDEAIICLKAAQKYAKELSDLTRITVSAHLTSQKEHPRGVKLKGTTVQRDIKGNIISDKNMSIALTEAIGRCTYPLKSGAVITNAGPMVITNKEGSLKLTDPSAEDLYSAVVVFKGDNILVEAKVNPYVYIKKSELLNSISNIKLDTAKTNGRHVFAEDINGQILALEIRSVKGEISNIEHVDPIECFGVRPFGL